ncbi:MAG: hypothetical protein HY236_02940 [Acidobacteria bacterium]|nr:hypothetical protein [Acidobacteriota bacterium]
MACPYFYPAEKLGQVHQADLFWPLGDGYAGWCTAEPGVEFQPEKTALVECCNLGYARGSCERFPRGGGPDAVRFSVTDDRDGIIRVYFVVEGNHRPREHGPLEYEVKRRAMLVPHPDPIVNRQAEAYVESYLRRKPRRKQSS